MGEGLCTTALTRPLQVAAIIEDRAETIALWVVDQERMAQRDLTRTVIANRAALAGCIAIEQTACHCQQATVGDPCSNLIRQGFVADEDAARHTSFAAAIIDAASIPRKRAVLHVQFPRIVNGIAVILDEMTSNYRQYIEVDNCMVITLEYAVDHGQRAAIVNPSATAFGAAMGECETFERHHRSGLDPKNGSAILGVQHNTVLARIESDAALDRFAAVDRNRAVAFKADRLAVGSINQGAVKLSLTARSDRLLGL